MKIFNRNFTLMVIGQIISITGASILRFALSLYVLDITKRADVFATILAISMIPVIILSPLGGAIADRFSRKRLMVAFDFASSAVILLFFISTQIFGVSVVLIGVVMTLLTVISTIYQPAVQASIPVLISGDDNLVKANGVVSGVGALSGILGPILGGILYALIGLNWLIIISCITFFLSAVMEIFIKIPFVKKALDRHIIPSLIGDMKEGVTYVAKENPIILKIMGLSAAFNLFLVPLFSIGVPYIVKIVLNSTDVMYGISQAALAASSIIGAILVSVISKKLKMSNIYILLTIEAIMMIPMAIAILPSIQNLGQPIAFWGFTLSAVAMLILTTTVSIFCIAHIQKETPNHMLGKVMAILSAASTCAAPIGQVIYGALQDSFSKTSYILVFIICGVTFLLAFVTKLIVPKNYVMENVMVQENITSLGSIPDQANTCEQD